MNVGDPGLMHGAHDYRALIRRWRIVSRAAGLEMKPFASVWGHHVYFLRSRARAGGPQLYVSAGIHGDEPAGCEGMVRWAENNVKRLSRIGSLLFPCLNPWGLTQNMRVDAEGRDLNRAFHEREHPLIVRWREILGESRFDLALTLHEDYDGQGLYIYEVQRVKPFWGEALLKLAHPDLAIEGRAKIEGRAARGGLVRRRIDLRKFPQLPEAVYLHLHHSQRTFTFETPSEADIEKRVRVQMRLIDESVRRMEEEARDAVLSSKRIRS